MTIYQEEMQRKAQHYGCLTDYDEADQLLLISHKGVHLTAVNPEGFMYYNNKDLTDPESREVFSRLVDDAEVVRAYVGLYVSAPQMQPKDVQNYRKFSEYGDVVFAGMYSEKHGFMFCSWRQSDGGKYVAHGNYSPDYLVSKENFAVRAGLVDDDKLFTKEEAEELFKCAAFARDNCESLTYEQDRGLMELMEKLWALTVNEQDTRSGITFRDLFTPEELYAVWECVNYRFYHQRGPGAFNRGYALRYATALLEEIIARADGALVRGTPSADLRFGHDGNLMPLTCLMAFDGCTAEVSDPDLIADAWRDYRISPMAANIQMIFYRKEGTADILVRILHNEHEMYLPLASARPPYYKWDDLRAFYHRRIAEAKGTAAEPPSAGALQAPGA